MTIVVKRKVLVVQPIHAAGLELLAARPDVEIIQPASAAASDVQPLLGDAAAVLLRGSSFPPEFLAAAPGLKVLSRHGVGLDNVPVEACARHGVTVTHVGDVLTAPVAEHTMALILAVAKRLLPYDRAVRTGGYAVKESLSTRELQAKTILVLGLGRTGREVARLAGAFRMRCLAFDPALAPEAIRASGCEPVENWRLALLDIDDLTLHLPLAAGARGLIGAAELRAMKAGAVLINCARGGLVDGTALDAALSSGGLMGAGLDVTETEPPLPGNPLLLNDRVVLSPHSAALTLECAVRMAERAARNITDFFDGRLDPAYVARAPEASNSGDARR